MKIIQGMRKVNHWIEDHGLSLATEKTEIVLLERRRVPTEVKFRVADELIASKPAVKYLGVHLNTKHSF